MMGDQLALRWRDNHTVLMPPNGNKDQVSRMGFFVDWLAEIGAAWYRPDLNAYAQYLMHERTRIDPQTGEPFPALLSPITVQSHISTIRARYEALLRDNGLRDWLYSQTPSDAPPASRKALVDEIIVRLHNSIDPANIDIPTYSVLDEADSDHLRLTPAQVRALVRAPGLGSLPALRDTALIALLVCTGVREAELVSVTVPDLRESLSGEMALRVRDGKNHKQRLIPYGPLDWCLLYVERWLAQAQISTGPVFRGFFKGNKRIRKTALTTRAVNQIMNHYPISIDGKLRPVQPHDLRRSYARNAYENGMDIVRIKQNLGHANLQTTLHYIGDLDAAQRVPPDMFLLPHSHRELRNADEGY